MRTFLITQLLKSKTSMLSGKFLACTLLVSSATLVSANPVQQAPLPENMDNAMQSMPQQSTGDDAMQQAIPAITPQMQRLLMRQAERMAAQETARAAEDTSNARIQGTQRQQ